MDNQMVYDLFYNTIAAAGLMNENTAFTDSLQTVVNNLAPMQVGRWGQLQEWMHDWDNPKIVIAMFLISGVCIRDAKSVPTTLPSCLKLPRSL